MKKPLATFLLSSLMFGCSTPDTQKPEALFPHRTDVPRDDSHSKQEGFTPPSPVSTPIPSLPEDSTKITENAFFAFVLEADGSVHEVVVLETSGDPKFDQQIVESIKRWKYKPAMLSGVAFPTICKIPINIEN